MKQLSKQLISYILTLVLMLNIVFVSPLSTPQGQVYAAPQAVVSCSAGTDDSDTMGAGTWAWNGTSKTLTLSGITYSNSFDTTDNVRAFYLPANSTIVVVGTNSISLSNANSGAMYGIYCVGSTIITGSGVLNINISSQSHAYGIHQKANSSSDVLSVNCALSISAVSSNPGFDVCAMNSLGGNININSSLISSGGLFTINATANKIIFASAGTPFTLSWPAPSPAPTPTPSPFPSPTPSPDPTPSPAAYSTPTDLYYPEYFIFTPKATGGSININLYRRFNEVGSRVQFGYEAQEGYELLEIKAVTVSGKEIPVTILSDSTAQLIMPGEDVYVTPLFKKTTS